MGKGATGQQESIANNTQSFMTTLQGDYGTAFAGQQNILNGLNTALTNTMKGGPSQFGFSTAENTALNTTATEGSAQALQNTKAAVGEAGAAKGGGATLPTGSQEGTTAALEQNAAQSKSTALLGIQEAGYEQGTKNYNNSVSGLSSVASIENPTGLASAANEASSTAMNEASTVYQENQAASPWAMIGGLVGSLSSSAISMLRNRGGGGANASNIGSAPGSATTAAGGSMTGANDLGMSYGSSAISGLSDLGSAAEDA